MTTLKERYRTEIAPKLKEELGLSNMMEVPRVTKITLNMGVGEAVGDKKVLENALADMEKIAGQKPVVTKSRKSIAGFKIRDGWPIGCKVTLRDERMYEFLDRLIAIAIPRIRDFRGISGKQFDGRGNFAMGVTEQIIFPEIDYDQVDKLRGMDIVITTSASNDEQGRALLSAFNFHSRARTELWLRNLWWLESTSVPAPWLSSRRSEPSLKRSLATLTRVMTIAGKLRCSSRSCLATPVRSDSSVVVRLRDVRTVCTESSVCAAISYVRPPCAAMYQAWLSPAGNGDDSL